MFDFVRIRLTYLDWAEETDVMARWLADVFLEAIAGGWQWTPGHRVCRALVIPA
jgi:hypothetical protein